MVFFCVSGLLCKRRFHSQGYHSFQLYTRAKGFKVHIRISLLDGWIDGQSFEASIQISPKFNIEPGPGQCLCEPANTRVNISYFVFFFFSPFFLLLFWEHNRTNPLQKGTNTYVIFLIPCKGPMYTFYGNTG